MNVIIWKKACPSKLVFVFIAIIGYTVVVVVVGCRAYTQLILIHTYTHTLCEHSLTIKIKESLILILIHTIPSHTEAYIEATSRVHRVATRAHSHIHIQRERRVPSFNFVLYSQQCEVWFLCKCCCFCRHHQRRRRRAFCAEIFFAFINCAHTHTHIYSA